MADVYSRPLVAVQGYTGPAALAFTCPPGYVAVVKTILMTTGHNLVPGDMRVYHGPLGEALWTYSAPSTEFFTAALTGAHIVLDPGDTLAVFATNWICDFYAGGYLLTLP